MLQLVHAVSVTVHAVSVNGHATDATGMMWSALPLVALALHVQPRSAPAPRAAVVSPLTLPCQAEPLRLALPRPPADARPHQRDALNAIWSHFAHRGPVDGGDGDVGVPPVAAARRGADDDAGASRATVVLPPGTGKTLVGLWAVEAAARKGTACVVVVPTLPLIDQTLAAYRAFSPAIAAGRTKVLVVGSDCAAASVAYTCKADEIADYLARHADETVVVLSTYDSLPAFADGAQTAGAGLELCVFDEAHYMAGRGRKDGFGLQPANLPSSSRARPACFPTVARRAAAMSPATAVR